MQERLIRLLLKYGKDEKFDLGVFYYSFRGAKFLVDQIFSLIKEEMPKKKEFWLDSEKEQYSQGWNDYHDEMLKKMES